MKRHYQNHSIITIAFLFLLFTINFWAKGYATKLKIDNNFTLNRVFTSNDSVSGAQVELKYKFEKHYPISLKISNDKIFVATSKCIYVFSSKGAFFKKINIPKSIPGVVDFAVYESPNETLFYVLCSGTVFCFNQNAEVLYSNNAKALSLKIDKLGNVYYISQKYEQKIDSVFNILSYIDKKGASKIVYPNYDLGTFDFEIVDSSIMFINSSSIFVGKSTSTGKEIANKSIDGLKERVWFQGKVENYYIFREFDYQKKVDHIIIYDSNFKLHFDYVLNYSNKNLVKEQRFDSDFLFDYPSGNIFCFDGKNVYYLRNTTKGSFVSLIRIH
jgi:hypothetical protein